MRTKIKWIAALMAMILVVTPVTTIAVETADNGNMKVYPTSGGLEMSELKGFDIQGYVTTDESTNAKTLISSTFSNNGYHTFLNVNGINGEMDEALSDDDGRTWSTKASAMQYTAVEGEGWQTINGIQMRVSTDFINNGEQLKITYTLKNTTTSTATFSLATAADVEIDDDDRATIERLEDGSGVRLWTKDGYTKKPVQFVFYGRGVDNTTDIDALWIGTWGCGAHIVNMFVDNTDVEKVEDEDSAFAFSWVNRTIGAGETQTYSVLMEVGEINIPNTGITLENNTKFYYKDVKINGTVFDKDLKDKITIHYIVDGREYTLPEISTTGTVAPFTLDLTSLNLSAVTEHTLKVWATDSTNCDSNVEERTFIVTYVKEPEVTLSSTEWTQEATFRITDTENEPQYVGEYQYRVNNGEWVTCQKDIDIPIQATGNVTIDVRVAGTYTGDYSNIVTVHAKIDKENPTTTAPTATKTTCSITVNAEQQDTQSGIDTSKTMYAIEKDGVWSEWQESNVFTGLTDNTEYTIKTKAVDKAGNIAESEEITIKTDELLLGDLLLKLNNASGSNYTENTWTNQNIYIAIEERSIGAITTYKSLENAAQTITETNQETTVTTTGITPIVLSVTDGTNTIESDIEHILKVDKVAPVITELSLDNDDWSKEAKTITGKAQDTLSGIVAYQFSTEEGLTATSNGWIAITETTDPIEQTKEITDNGTVYFYVKDAAGNITAAGIDTKIDSQGPIINFSRVDGKTSIHVTDTGAGLKNTYYAWTTDNVEPNEADWQEYSTAVTYTGTSKGKIYLWAKSVDNLGNTTISSTVFSALRTPTVVADDVFTNQNIAFQITSETEDTDVLYQFKIDNGEWQNITKDSLHTITNITDGQVIISARILDNAGRYSEVSTKTVSVSFGNTEEENNQGDTTTADGLIPQAGEGTFLMIASILTFISISIFLYRKLSVYKDLK